MPPSSTATQQDRQLQVEPEPELTISANHLEYIQSLNESPGCYARFFDALLIKKSSHADFFHDLKTFREQPAIIRLLQEPGTREAYRECTTVFLGSRFAHPWCRTSAAHSSGWTKASWVGRTKKLDVEAKKEEDKLHRLLVPIWIAFQRRMFPGTDVVDDWVSKAGDRDAEREARARAKEEATAAELERAKASAPKPVYRELGFANAADSSSTSSVQGNPHANDGSGAAAANLFLGAAVTGFIMSDKRVKKYVTKQLRKK